jgi:hypothetical protein
MDSFNFLSSLGILMGTLWIPGLKVSLYFNTFQGIFDNEKLQITSLQIEGSSHDWWHTLLIGTHTILD